MERPVRGYSIEVYRTEFDEQDEDDGLWWGAEAGLTGDSQGVDHESREDLADCWPRSWNTPVRRWARATTCGWTGR